VKIPLLLKAITTHPMFATHTQLRWYDKPVNSFTCMLINISHILVLRLNKVAHVTTNANYSPGLDFTFLASIQRYTYPGKTFNVMPTNNLFVDLTICPHYYNGLLVLGYLLYQALWTKLFVKALFHVHTILKGWGGGDNNLPTNGDKNWKDK